MTFDTLQLANKQIKTIDVKGKQYAEVNQRIKAFRILYPEGCIETELISMKEGVCVFRAIAKDGLGNIIGTGHACEKEDSSFINKTSYIENCETSAVGRALGMCGIGIDVSVSSADELMNALKQQKELEPISEAQKATLEKCIPKHGQTVENVMRVYHITDLSELKVKDFIRLMDRMGEQ